MSWQPTIGTLSADRLAEIREYLGPRSKPVVHHVEPKVWGSLLLGHIDALTKQLERARSIAVSLEQELARRGAGTWPMRQYATVELPDELLLGVADMHRIGAHLAGSVDVDGQVADAGMGA